MSRMRNLTKKLKFFDSQAILVIQQDHEFEVSLGNMRLYHTNFLKSHGAEKHSEQNEKCPGEQQLQNWLCIRFCELDGKLYENIQSEEEKEGKEISLQDLCVIKTAKV